MDATPKWRAGCPYSRMTTEAAAWREGWDAAMVAAARTVAPGPDSADLNPAVGETLRIVARAIARIEMPEPMPEPPGTEYRG